MSAAVDVFDEIDAQVINAKTDMEVCWAAASAPEAMAALERGKPDMMTVDITLPGRNGLELIKDVLALVPGLPILVISMHEETLYAQRVLKCGAKGYIMKDAPHDDLMAAIRRVAGGKGLDQRGDVRENPPRILRRPAAPGRGQRSQTQRS